MKFFIVLSLLNTLSTFGFDFPHQQSELPPITTDNSEGRITNGELANAGQFPYQVGLVIDLENSNCWCGGTLISELWILTAAHCTNGSKAAMVFLGAIDVMNDEEEGQLRLYVPKSNIITHPDWDRSKFRNDISLIQLSEPVEFNDRIQPATLPKKNGPHSSYEGENVWATGWGRESDTATTISQYLRYIEVPVIRRSTCNFYFLGAITEKMLCISGRDGKSACNGDSGGPLVYKDGDTNYVIGATSFGAPRGCEKGWPGVFTRVTSYLDWIEDVSGVSNK